MSCISVKVFFFNVKRATWEKIFVAWKEAGRLQVRNATSSRRLGSETSLKLNVCSSEDTLLTDGENCYRLAKENQILNRHKGTSMMVCG